jgi:anti-sigma factor RsiW
MNCKEIEHQLIFLIDGELPEKLTRELTDHIQVCKACEAKYHYLKEALSGVNEIKNEKPRAFFYTRLIGRMEGSERKVRQLQWAPLSIASILVIGLLAGTLIGKLTVPELSQAPSAYTLSDMFNEVRLESMELIILNN